MNKDVKNVLTAVGAIAVVKAAPVLAAGVAIGAVVANPEKAKKAVKDFVSRVETGLAKYDLEAWMEAEMAKHAEEDECECCHGGKCDCEDECCCDYEDEPDQVFEDTEALTEAEESVPYEEGTEDESDETPIERGDWSAT